MIDFDVAQYYTLNMSAASQICSRRDRAGTFRARHCLLMIALLLLPTTSRAAPWGDYELAIGDGYGILVCSEGSSCMKEGRDAVLQPGNYQGIAPCIVRYAATKQHVFIQSVRTRGDGLRVPQAFFILVKGSDLVIGPLSVSEFDQHPVVLASAPLDWRQPENPHPYHGILLLFLGTCVDSFGGSRVLWACMAVGLLFVAAMLLRAYERFRETRREASR